MEKFMEVVAMIPDYMVAINGVLLAIIGVSILIPGEQPEKFLKSVVGVIEKLSIKKK